MNTTLYRGIDRHSGLWVYGYYVGEHGGNAYIIEPHNVVYDIGWVQPSPAHMCIPETVGMYSTINDKNGKSIYEGDKIRFYQVNDCSHCRDVWEDEPEEYIEEITGIVRFKNGIFSVYFDSNEQENANMPLELLSKDVFPSFANQPIEEAYKYLTNLNEFPFLTDGKDIDVAEVIGNIYEN